MSGRRVRTLAIAAAALVLSAPAAIAAKPKPTLKPTFAVASASVVGSALKLQLTATFAAPKGVTASKACKGTVSAKLKVSKTKTAALSGTVKADGGVCTATLTKSLPKALAGTTKTVAFVLAPSAVHAGFSTSKALKLAPTPTPTPNTNTTTTPTATTPTTTNPTTPIDPGTGPPATVSTLFEGMKGRWATENETPGSSRFQFAVDNTYVLRGLQQYGGSFRWTCTSGLSSAAWFTNESLQLTGNTAHFQFHFAPDAHPATQVDFIFNFTFDAITGRGTGNVYANGAWDFGGGSPESCSMTETFDIYKYAPF